MVSLELKLKVDVTADGRTKPVWTCVCAHGRRFATAKAQIAMGASLTTDMEKVSESLVNAFESLGYSAIGGQWHE
jgi:hypothetical protein